MALLDQQVAGAAGCDLGRVGDDEDLAARGEPVQALADRARDRAADAAAAARAWLRAAAAPS